MLSMAWRISMSWTRQMCTDCGVAYCTPAEGNAWYCRACWEDLKKKDPQHPFVLFMGGS